MRFEILRTKSFKVTFSNKLLFNLPTEKNSLERIVSKNRLMFEKKIDRTSFLHIHDNKHYCMFYQAFEALNILLIYIINV